MLITGRRTGEPTQINLPAIQAWLESRPQGEQVPPEVVHEIAGLYQRLVDQMNADELGSDMPAKVTLATLREAADRATQLSGIVQQILDRVEQPTQAVPPRISPDQMEEIARIFKK